MSKRNNVKASRKVIEPLFHTQTKEENNSQLSKALIKTTRQTGKLNLSGRSLNMVPERLWSLYEIDKEALNLDYRLNNSTEDQPWWNFTPLQYLDLSSNCLSDIPSNIKMFQDLQVLNLHDNLLTDLPKELEELVGLMKLNISHNKLQIIPNCVYKLTELTSLLISYNNIEQISKDIGDLIMLQELDLSHNQIEELPPGLGYMVRLTQANFSYNKLVELPPDIVNMRVLIKLDVTHNELKSLPPMGELRKLQFLYATHNDILKMPDCEGCESLQELYLGNNFIEEITPEFCESMPHIKVLDLKDNKIKEIPDDISKLGQLIRFDITNNELSNLPNCLGFMKRLQNLSVEGNKIRLIRRDILQCGTVRILKFLRDRSQAELEKCDTESSNASTPRSQPAPIELFPDKWDMKNGRMLNLTMKQVSTVPDEVFKNALDANVNNIDFSRNKFTEVPSNLEQLAEHIQELNFCVNMLSTVPDFLSKFAKLQYLNLSSNVLSTLPDSLGECKHIRELVISNNKFVELPSCIFEMEGLEILLASDNRITSINAEGFLKLKRLATLDLSNNNIDHVPPELGKMTQLRSLLITGNSFRAPRYAILVKGTDAILSYLRDRIPNNS